MSDGPKAYDPAGVGPQRGWKPGDEPRAPSHYRLGDFANPGSPFDGATGPVTEEEIDRIEALGRRGVVDVQWVEVDDAEAPPGRRPVILLEAGTPRDVLRLVAEVRRRGEELARHERIVAKVHAALDAAGAPYHGEVDPARYALPPGTKRGDPGCRGDLGRGTFEWRIAALGERLAQAQRCQFGRLGDMINPPQPQCERPATVGIRFRWCAEHTPQGTSDLEARLVKQIQHNQRLDKGAVALAADLRTVMDASSIQDAVGSYRSWSPAEREAWDRLRAFCAPLIEGGKANG